MTTNTEQAVELKPCPFCGLEPDSYPSGDGTGTMIECMTPGCVHPHVSYYGYGEAARRWNTRALTPADPAGDGIRREIERGLRLALYQCRMQFLEYARQHDAKGTPEAAKKAEVNRTFAKMIADVCAVTPPAPSEGEAS